MQLNAKGLVRKPQGANCSHVLDSGERVFRTRLSATPSDHAFRPRLPATLYSHAFRRAKRIEDVMFLATAISPAGETLADTVVLELVSAENVVLPELC